MDVDPAPSSFTVTAFGDRVLKRISAWNTENQGNEGMVKEKGGVCLLHNRCNVDSLAMNFLPFGFFFNSSDM